MTILSAVYLFLASMAPSSIQTGSEPISISYTLFGGFPRPYRAPEDGGICFEVESVTLSSGVLSHQVACAPYSTGRANEILFEDQISLTPTEIGNLLQSASNLLAHLDASPDTSQTNVADDQTAILALNILGQSVNVALPRHSNAHSGTFGTTLDYLEKLCSQLFRLKGRPGNA